MTAFAFDTAMAALGANGPEDKDLGWDTIGWPVHEEHVRRLRGRIFKASKVGDLATVRNLQKMMLRSWSNTLISVRQERIDHIFFRPGREDQHVLVEGVQLAGEPIGGTYPSDHRAVVADLRWCG